MPEAFSYRKRVFLLRGEELFAWNGLLQSRGFLFLVFFHVLIKMSLFIRGFHLFLIEPFHVNKFLYPTSGLMNIKGGCCPREDTVDTLLPNKFKTMRVIKISTFILN